jgi:lipoate-protein ligase A
MALPVRVIDTGVREGRANIAFDAALAELHGEGRIGDTLRFLRFRPTALVGRHQSVAREIDLAHCRANGIAIARRITGGGAIFFDEGQLGWELVVSRRRMGVTSLADMTARICGGAAQGLSRAFGIDARFRPRNDIEVGGRKLCGTGGFFDGDTLFFQGTVLIDVAPERVMAALVVPRAKLEKRALDRAEHRIVTLAELLGRAPAAAEVQGAIRDGLGAALDLELADDAVSAEEEARAAALLTEDIGTDAFVHGLDGDRDGGASFEASRTGPGGTITVAVRLDGSDEGARLRDVLITGDFFVAPPRLVMDLEAALRGVPAAVAGQAARAFLTETPYEALSVDVDDFRAVIEAAVTAALAQSG